MDPDTAQLRVVGRLVPSAGGLGVFAEHVAASRAAYLAHAEGTASNECAVIAGVERCDGETGRAIIRAIVTGIRSPKLLAALRDPGCKHSEEEIEKALTGTWREEHLFILKQSLELYDFYTKQVEACDAEIDRMYGLIRPEWEMGELPPIPKKKQSSHSKNAPKM